MPIPWDQNRAPRVGWPRSWPTYDCRGSREEPRSPGFQQDVNIQISPSKWHIYSPDLPIPYSTLGFL